MIQTEQISERGIPARRLPRLEREIDERAARRALRGQIARLERELSGIVAGGFPHLSPPPVAAQAGAGPCLPTLEALERTRDELVGRVQKLRRLASERAESERRARALLARMKLEPGRYKFARLPVRDLGQGGCGVWEVRPRLGLLGMLAGWWQVKLSSGCPLPGGPRADARPRFCYGPGSAGAIRSDPGYGLGTRRPWPLPGERECAALVRGARGLGRAEARRGERSGTIAARDDPQQLHERVTLALGHRLDRLLLGHRDLREEPAATRLAPSVLAHQQSRHRHVARLPRAVEDHLRDADLSDRDPALELGAREAHLVRALQSAHVLRTGRGDRRCRVHVSTLPVGAARAATPTCCVIDGKRSPRSPEIPPRRAESRSN
jgi:hypothetical protein